MRKTTQTHTLRALVRSLLCGLFLSVSTRALKADPTWIYAVQISATVQVSPPQITLYWEPDEYGANSYTIYRKTKSATAWGSPIASLSGSAGSFADTAVAVGSAYEYQIVKAASYGYT